MLNRSEGAVMNMGNCGHYVKVEPYEYRLPFDEIVVTKRALPKWWNEPVRIEQHVKQGRPFVEGPTVTKRLLQITAGDDYYGKWFTARKMANEHNLSFSGTRKQCYSLYLKGIFDRRNISKTGLEYEYCRASRIVESK